jgi:PleD family two-component response regulator
MPADANASPLTQFEIKVLLVDDQPIVAETVKRMLAGEANMELNYCADPAKAIPEALQFSPTVILQDLMMPDIDGLTLVKWYRAHPKLRDIPLIVLSSREEATTKAEAFALGANDYLPRPLSTSCHCCPSRSQAVASIQNGVTSRQHNWVATRSATTGLTPTTLQCTYWTLAATV